MAGAGDGARAVKRNAALLALGSILALSSALVVAQDAPESLLPPGFDKPRPAPPRAAPAPVTVTKGSTSSGSSSVSVPVVQQVPGAATPVAAGLPAGWIATLSASAK